MSIAPDKTLRIETPRVFAPLLNPARYKGTYGGRGSGKSHFFAELMLERVAFEPLRAVCIREIQKSLDQSVKRLLEDKIENLNLGSYFNVFDSRIDARSGGFIIFQGMQNHTAETIKSLEGYDIAWVEEAQALSERSLTLLRPTIRKNGSELWFSWNPRSAKDPVDAMLRGGDLPADACVVEANYEDNPWFPDVLRAEMEYDKRRDPDRYAHVWRGKYERHSTARVFRNWKIEAFDTPKDARFYFGADWGFSVDPTILIRCFVQGRRLFVDQEAYEIGCEIDHIPALFAGSDNKSNPRWKNPKNRPGIEGALRWPIVADSARPETISYMAKRGFNIRAAVKGKGSVEDGIEFLKSYDITVHPRCKHTADELSFYSYKTDKLTGEVLPQLEDDNNHVIDALRYAVESTRRGAPLVISDAVLQRASAR